MKTKNTSQWVLGLQQLIADAIAAMEEVESIDTSTIKTDADAEAVAHAQAASMARWLDVATAAAVPAVAYAIAMGVDGSGDRVLEHMVEKIKKAALIQSAAASMHMAMDRMTSGTTH